MEDIKESLLQSANTEVKQSKPGWKSMPYIIGYETLEKIANFGLTANIMVYFMREYNMGQVVAANIYNTWSAVCNVMAVVGAFVADACLGRFRTIAFSSFASLMGMVILTMTAALPYLRPLSCTVVQDEQVGDCPKYYIQYQLGILLVGLFCLSIGGGGIRPCSVPFAVDQFDLNTCEGKKGSKTFYNWYYNTYIMTMLINMTVMVYIQDKVSWILGFGIPTLVMVCAILLLFSGSKIYANVEPQGSMFSRVAQVFVSAYRKRGSPLPSAHVKGAFYDGPEFVEDDKMPLTEQLRFLNKAALIIGDDQLEADGSSANPWRCSTIQQVEEVKCLIKMIPLWIASFITYLPITLSFTFPISQALKMDRHIVGPNYLQIPASSISVITFVTLAIVTPLYSPLLQPFFAKITKQEEGLTTLQRIGFGNIFSILELIASGLVERQRRLSAISHKTLDGVAPMSALWLAPQNVLLGLSEVFNMVGYIELYNKESPANMGSIANALYYLTFAAASNLCNLLMYIVHNVSGKHGKPDWIDDDINEGRLDYFYFLIAALCLLNFVYFVFCAGRFSYKITV